MVETKDKDHFFIILGHSCFGDDYRINNGKAMSYEGRFTSILMRSGSTPNTELFQVMARFYLGRDGNKMHLFTGAILDTVKLVLVIIIL